MIVVPEAHDTWAVPEKALISGDPPAVYWDSTSRRIQTYPPTEHTEIPEQLARLHESDDPEASTRRFVEAYGLLGHQQIMEASGRKPKNSGDPLWWVLAHSRAVAALLDALEALQEGHEGNLQAASSELFEIEEDAQRSLNSNEYNLWSSAEEAEQYFVEELKEPPLTDRERLKIGSRLELERRRMQEERPPALLPAKQVSMSYRGVHPLEVMPSDPRRWAPRSHIANVINGATQHTKELLLYDEKGDTFGVVLHFNALIEVVYWILRTTLIGNGKPVRRCVWCKQLFVQKHGHQKYCSPPPHYAKSRCETAYWNAKRS